jgi:DNA-binding response OmpR family regulator
MEQAAEDRETSLVPLTDPHGVALVATDDQLTAARLVSDLTAIGYIPGVASLRAHPDQMGPAAVVLVVLSPDSDDALRFSHHVRRSASYRGTPLVWAADVAHLGATGSNDHLFDDFLELPHTRRGLEARLRLVRQRAGGGDADILRRGSLVLNLATYQASASGRPLDLTFMEYQMLRFLVAQPGRVHTRQAIVRKVWGYDYFGGIRTVDVHIRRLRSKLGQEHARLIETVRSVGYRFADEGPSP